MSVMEVGTRNRFRMSNAVTRAWEIMSANFVLFFGIALLIALPMAIWQLSYGDEYMLKMQAIQAGVIKGKDAQEIIFGYFRSFGLLGLLMMVLALVGYGVCCLAAFQHLCGERRPLSDNLGQALKRFFPLVGVGVLGYLGFIAGWILLIVPGIMLAVRWGLCGQVCVIEKTGPIASLKRSAQLTDGSRWPLFGFGILVVLASSFVSMLLSFPITWIAGRTVGLVASVLMQGAIAGYVYCLSVTVYQELRNAKEGTATPAVVAVFE